MTRGCPHQIYAALQQIDVRVCVCVYVLGYTIYPHTHLPSAFIL